MVGIHIKWFKQNIQDLLKLFFLAVLAFFFLTVPCISSCYGLFKSQVLFRGPRFNYQFTFYHWYILPWFWDIVVIRSAQVNKKPHIHSVPRHIFCTCFTSHIWNLSHVTHSHYSSFFIFSMLLLFYPYQSVRSTIQHLCQLCSCLWLSRCLFFSQAFFHIFISS